MSASLHMMGHHDPVTAEAHESDGVYYATFEDARGDRATLSDRDPERLIRLLSDAAREVARAYAAQDVPVRSSQPEECALCRGRKGPIDPALDRRGMHELCYEAAS